MSVTSALKSGDGVRITADAGDNQASYPRQAGSTPGMTTVNRGAPGSAGMSEQATDRYDCRFLTDLVTDGRVNFTETQREQFSRDASPHEGSLPDAVVWPASTGEVSRILSAAN